jgi:hypothetical protein
MDKFSPVDIALTSDISNETFKERSLIESGSTFENSNNGGSGTGVYCVVAWDSNGVVQKQACVTQS